MSATLDVSTSSWTTGVTFSVIAALVGACAKLCIRKSYTLLSSSHGEEGTEATTPEHSTIHPSAHRQQRPRLSLNPPPRQNYRRYCDITSDEEETFRSEEEEDYTEDEFGILYDGDDEFDGDDSGYESFESLSNSRTGYNALAVFEAYALRAVGLLGETVVGPLLNVYALQFASPSLLSPIGGGLTLAWVVALSQWTIDETPRPAQLRALPLILVGQVLVALGGDHTNVYAVSLADLERAYRRPEFIVYGLLVFFSLVVLVLMIRKGTPEWRRFAWGILGGVLTGSQCFVKDALAVMHGLEPNETQDAASHQASAVASMLSRIAAWPPELVGLSIIGGVIPLVGMVLMMECLKRYDATYTASMFTGSIVLSSSVLSAVRYGTFGNLPSVGTYLTGLAGILAGTALLATEAQNAADAATSGKPSNHHHPSIPLATGGGTPYGAIGYWPPHAV